MLIEILVSAVVLTIASLGVIAVLQTTTHSQAELRNSSEAYALAQEDQARMASMRLGALNRYERTLPVTVGSTTFQVKSRGVFINDNTSTPSCGEGTSSADYVEITSSVTWNGASSSEKAKIVSVLSPSNGSLDPNHGTIAFSVKTEAQQPVPRMLISAGSGAIYGETDAAGCAVFADVQAGNYTATISGANANAVNKNGQYSEQKTVTVVGGDTKTENFEFATPGSIKVGFRYRIGTGSTFAPSSSDSAVLFHPNMDTGTARVLGSPGGTRVASIPASPLFPFSSTYTVYAGSCTSNDPGTGAAKASALVTPTGTTEVTLQLPAFDPIVWSGPNASNKGTPLAGAEVWVRDTTCRSGSNLVTRVFTTNSEGRLPDLGLPWGSYTVCADTQPGTGTSASRTQTLASPVSVKSLTGPATANFYLGSGTSPASASGRCS